MRTERAESKAMEDEKIAHETRYRCCTLEQVRHPKYRCLEELFFWERGCMLNRSPRMPKA